jgi:hypothetical protein
MKTQIVKTAKAKRLLKQILLSAAVFLFSLKSDASDYYWVGGTGNWTDFASHWATTSGGTTFHVQEPTTNDDVFFDINSFSSANDTVYLSGGGSYQCRNFRCSGVTNSPLFYWYVSLTISGSFKLEPGVQIENGSLSFYNNFSDTIYTAGQSFNALSVNGSGTLILGDDYNGEIISITNTAQFKSNGKNINLGATGSIHLTGWNGFTPYFDFSNSIINCRDFDFSNVPGAASWGVTGTNTEIYCSGIFTCIGGIGSTFKKITCNGSSLLNCTIDELNTAYLYNPFGPNYNGGTIGLLNLVYDSSVAFSPNISGSFALTHASISGAQCQIAGRNIYDTLLVSNSPGIIINAGDSLIVNGQFKVSQISPSLFNLRSSNVSLPAFFKSPLNLCLDSLKIENIHASGNIPFHAGTNSIDLGGNTGWNFSSCSSAVGYYWVGGTGNWSDFANHWATASGGTTFHAGPPSPLDDVYFDGNSFPSINQDVLIDLALVFCKDFNWQSTVPGCRLYNVTVQNKISVFGSISITNYPLQYGGGGIISLESTLTNNTIDIQDTAYINLEFNNPAGAWTLIQPLNLVPKIRLKAGTLNTNNYPVNCGGIISNYGTANRFLNAGTTVFTVTDFSSLASINLPDTFAFKIDDLLNFNYINKNIYFKIATNNVDSTFWFNNVKEFELNASSYQYENVYVENDVVNGWPNLFRLNIYTQDTLIHNAYGNGDGFLYVKSPMGNLTLDSIVITNSLQTGLISASSSDTLKVNYMEAAAAGAVATYSEIKKVIANAKPLTPTSGFSTSGIIENVFINGNLNISTGSKNLHIKKCVTLQNGTFNTEVYFDTLMINQGFNYTIQQGDTITINDQFIANGSLGNYTLLQSSTVGTQANIQFPQGNICSDYLMIRDINAIGTNISAGANSIDLGNNTGWQFSPCSPPLSDVWPGDANYDLTANNVDVLNIGLAYGETGPARAGASNNWVAQPATDWSSFFLSAVNKKHADCDGNGVVDNNDTLAITLNYGLTHPARLASQNSNQTTAPPLYLVANPDTVMEGDTVEVDIYLGTQLIPVDSIYGIAFTINFDTALVDTSWMPFDFTGSWMGTPGVDLLPYDHKLFSEGKADVALTRTDHTNIGGYGYLGKMGAVIVDNVGTRLTTAPPYVTLSLSVSNVTALTATEFYLTISTSSENVEIDTLGTTGIHSSAAANVPFSVYPNPVHKTLNVFSYWLQGETNCTVELYNVMGEKIISKQIPVSQNRFSIDVSSVPQGMYFIKVIAARGTVNKKILVVKK